MLVTVAIYTSCQGSELIFRMHLRAHLLLARVVVPKGTAHLRAPTPTKDGVGGTAKGIDEALPEVLIGECIQAGVDHGVGIRQHSEALVHDDLP